MSPNRAKHNAKNTAIRAELAKATADWRPYHGGHYQFEFYPQAIKGTDDEGREVNSRLPGAPQTKAVQWVATTWTPEKN